MSAHLTLDLLCEIQRGDRNVSDLAVVALGHLLDLCPQCRRVVETWRDASVEQEDPPCTNDDRSRELLELPTDDGTQLIRLAPHRYHGRGLAERLLRNARLSLPSKPLASGAAARLARVVMEHSSLTPENAAVYARALGFEGNATRSLGQIARSQDFLETAQFLINSHSPEDRRSRAELDEFEAVLRRSQGRFDEAFFLYRSAIAFYKEQGLHIEEARILMSYAVLYRTCDDPTTAFNVSNRAEQACTRLWVQRPQMLKILRHNQVVFLREAGEHLKSRKLAEAVRDLEIDADDEWSPLRITWSDGEAAREEGDLATAERKIHEARSGFLAGGNLFDAALAGLDLASIYSSQDRLREVEAMLTEIVPVFEEQGVHSKAEAARQILRDALGSRREVN